MKIYRKFVFCFDTDINCDYEENKKEKKSSCCLKWWRICRRQKEEEEEEIYFLYANITKVKIYSFIISSPCKAVCTYTFHILLWIIHFVLLLLMMNVKNNHQQICLFYLSSFGAFICSYLNIKKTTIQTYIQTLSQIKMLT